MNSWKAVLSVKHRFVAAAFVLVTLLYAVVLPPFEVPDEQGHFAKAAQLAFRAYPSVRQNDQPGAMIPSGLEDLIQNWPPDAPSQGATRRPLSHVWHDLTTPIGGGMTFARFNSLGAVVPVFYVPQAIGLRIASLAGLTPLGQFYAGRLAGAAAAVTLVLLGVALMPYGKTAMLVIAVLPGATSQLGSYSADSLVIAITFLVTAILLRQQAAPATRSRWTLPVLVPLLTLAKGVYLPLAGLGMADRAAWQPRRLAWTLLWIAAGLTLFAVWFGVLARADDTYVYHYVSHRSLEHLTAATPQQQLGFMLAHPGAAGRAIFGTIIERAPVYAIWCIGRFGAFNVMLPLPLYALGAAVVAMGALATQRTEPLPSPWQRALWLGIVGTTVLLVHLFFYIASSGLGEDFVEGVQARYFIPVLPLLLLALRVRAGSAAGRVVEVALPGAAALLMAGGLATAATAFWRW